MIGRVKLTINGQEIASDAWTAPSKSEAFAPVKATLECRATPELDAFVRQAAEQLAAAREQALRWILGDRVDVALSDPDRFTLRTVEGSQVTAVYDGEARIGSVRTIADDDGFVTHIQAERVEDAPAAW